MKNFNTDLVLWWIIILKEYIPEIEYIPGKKNIVADKLLQLYNNKNQKTTHKSTYTTTKKVGTLRHQRTERGHVSSSIKTDIPISAGRTLPNGKIKCATYRRVLFVEDGML